MPDQREDLLVTRASRQLRPSSVAEVDINTPRAKDDTKYSSYGR
jgi:hypothetical protein